MAWNRPADDSATKKSLRSGKSPHWARGVVAGLIVVIGAAIAAWLFFSESDKRDSSDVEERTRGRIKETKPAVVHSKPIAMVTNAAPAKPKKVFKTYVDEKGVLRYEGGMAVRKPPVRTIKVGDHRPSIFKHVAEMQIEGLLEIEPGDMVVGTIEYGDNFTKSLRESFKEEIVINPEDDARTREMKQAVIDVKKDFKERMARGEDVGKLMSETREDLQRLGMYRQELENEVRTILNEKLLDDNFTDEDIQDCYSAANKMLEDKGVEKLRMPTTLFMRALRRSAKASQQGKENMK